MVTLAQQRAQSANTQAGVIADTGQQFMQFLLALMQQQEAKKDRAQDRAMQALQMQSLLQAMQQRAESGPTEQLLRELQLLTGQQGLRQEEEMQPARKRLLEAQATDAELRAQMTPQELAFRKLELDAKVQQLQRDNQLDPVERAVRMQVLELQAKQLGVDLELSPLRRASMETGNALAGEQLEAARRDNRAAEQLTGPQTAFELDRIEAARSLLPQQTDVTRAQGRDELARLEGETARRQVADATARAGQRAAEAAAVSAEANAATAGERARQELTLGDLQIEQASLNKAVSELEVSLGPEKAELLREQITAARAGNTVALIEALVKRREFFDGTTQQRQAVFDATQKIQLQLGQISLEEAQKRAEKFDAFLDAELAQKQASALLTQKQADGLLDAAEARRVNELKLNLESRQLELEESLFEQGRSSAISQASQSLLGAEGQAITLSSTAQATLEEAFAAPRNDAMQMIMGLKNIGPIDSSKVPTAYHRPVDPNDPNDELAAQNETVLQIVNDFLHASDERIENARETYGTTMGDSGRLEVGNLLRDSQRAEVRTLLRAGMLTMDSPGMLQALAALRVGGAFSDELHPEIQKLANAENVSKYIDRMPVETKARIFSNRLEDQGFQARALQKAVPDTKLHEQYFKIVNSRQVSRAFKDVLKLSLIDAVDDPEQADRLNTLLQDWTPHKFGIGPKVSTTGLAEPRGRVRGQDSEYLRGKIGDQFFASDRAKGHGFFGGNDVTLNGRRYENANEALQAGFLLGQVSPVENPGTPRERFVSQQPQYSGGYRYSSLGGARAQREYEESLRANPESPVDQLLPIEKPRAFNSTEDMQAAPPPEALFANMSAIPMGPVPVGGDPGFGGLLGYSPRPHDNDLPALQAMWNQHLQTPPAPALPAPQQMLMQMMPVPGAPVGAIPMMAPVDPMEQLRMILNPYSSPVP